MQSRTYLYSILIRGGPGGVSGAQATDITEMLDGHGNVVQATESAARPVSNADIAAILSGKAADLLTAFSAAHVERSDLAGELSAVSQQRDALAIEAAEQARQITRLTAEANANSEDGGSGQGGPPPP